MKLRNVVIVDGMRSPFSWGGRGKFEATRLDDVAVIVLRTLMERNPKVNPTMVEDIGLGHWAAQPDICNISTITRLGGFPEETTGFVTNRECGSSMDTLHRLATSIMVGASDCAIALGVERTGRALAGAGQQGTNRVTDTHPDGEKRNNQQRDMAHDHDRYFSVPIPDAILDSPPQQSMPQTAQNVVDMYGIPREELDAFTVRSHHKLAAEYEAGIYKDEVVPMEVEDPVFDENKMWVAEERGQMVLFDRDECIRPNSSMESLAKLGAIRGLVSYIGRDVRVTAGNSCPTNSGASALLVMAEELAIQLGLEPLARIIGIGVAGVKGQIMGMGPVPATYKAMKHAGITSDQIDRVEFNEAFAAQVIPSINELGIPEEKVNVNGGSLGIGHPIGATGARLVMTVAKELRRSNKRYGLATQCIGAGQGISTIIEALN